MEFVIIIFLFFIAIVSWWVSCTVRKVYELVDEVDTTVRANRSDLYSMGLDIDDQKKSLSDIHQSMFSFDDKIKDLSHAQKINIQNILDIAKGTRGEMLLLVKEIKELRNRPPVINKLEWESKSLSIPGAKSPAEEWEEEKKKREKKHDNGLKGKNTWAKKQKRGPRGRWIKEDKWTALKKDCKKSPKSMEH